MQIQCASSTSVSIVSASACLAVVAALTAAGTLWEDTDPRLDPGLDPEGSAGSAVRPEILVRPRVVHVGSRVLLRLEGLPPATAETVFRWRVATSAPPERPTPERQGAPGSDAGAAPARGGDLLSDDLEEVQWRAPAQPGTYAVEASREDGSRQWRARVEIDVRRHSVEGMVWVPPGPFLRGDLAGHADPDEVKTVQNAGDEPIHVVDLDGFWIDRHLVTNHQYARFLQDSVDQGLARVEGVAVMGLFEGSEVPFYYFRSYEELFPDLRERFNPRTPRFLHWIRHEGGTFRIEEGKERCPVVDVSWFGAAAYAAFHGKSLPTEAQWEKAARGTDGRRFPWGDAVPTLHHVNLDHALGQDPLPVGTFSPTGDSPYGVADMVSSIFEWTDDWFDPDYYEDNAGEAALRNPHGRFWGKARAIRGSPSTLLHPQASIEAVEPVSSRYSWHFEFFLGDAFANAETGFRTVVGNDVPGGGDAPEDDTGAGHPELHSAPPDLHSTRRDGVRVDGAGPDSMPPVTESDSSCQPEAPRRQTGLRGPEYCATCHPQQYFQWRGSMHAHSAVDPLFQACNAKAQEETGGKIGDLCVGCHIPIGARTGEAKGGFDPDRLSPLAASGVSCEFCHKVSGPKEGTHPSNGSLAWSTDMALRGNLPDPRSSPSHESVTTGFLGESEFCGRCHDVRIGDEILEKTYAQWSASIHRDRATRCQDCHMLRYSGRAAVDGPFRDTLRRHEFPGVSVPLVRFPNRGHQREMIEEMLRGAVRLSVFPPRVVEAGGELVLAVAVKNVGAGHNVPTGFSTKRQMWIEVTVEDPSGTPLFLSGHTDADGNLLDHHSRHAPGEDPSLALFADRFVDSEGREVPFLWRAARLDERSLAPMEERTAVYRTRVPESLDGRTVRCRVRVLFRPFAPWALAELGLESLATEVQIWEMASWDTGPIPVLEHVPRKTEYRVPGDFPTIAEAVDAMRDGDTLIVRGGEHRLDRPLDFRGKAIRVRSADGAPRTVLRFAGTAKESEAALVVFRTGETREATLEGFTLTGGRGILVDGLRRGGGVLVARSSPTLRDLRILDCVAPGGVGGGIAVENGAPLIVGGEIVGCQAERGGGIALVAPDGAVIEGTSIDGTSIDGTSIDGTSIEGNVAREGGGIYVEERSRLRLTRTILAGNIAWGGGGALAAARDSTLVVARGTIVLNRSGEGPGAVALGPGASLRVAESIVWGNEPSGLAATIDHAIVDPATVATPGFSGGDRVVSDFPFFLDPGGSWQPGPRPLEGDASGPAPWALGRWVGGDYRLLPGSPAIDGGDADSPPDPDDTRADLGARFFEQPLRAFVRGDADGDGRVALSDLAALVAYLIANEALPCLDAADVDDSGAIDPIDAALLAAYISVGLPLPASPFPDCGIDPTHGEGLSCERKAEPCR